ncbi:DUF1573 domain-containing protein [Verrucomicrobiota bacterium]
MGHYAKLIFVALIAITEAATAAPVIYCEQAEWDFGAISDAVSVTNRFLIENRGDSSLLVTDVKSSCGCTTVSLPNKQLAPGGLLPVSVVFNPKKRSGKQRKTIRVYSNDSNTPELKLTLSGRVNPQVITMPSAITFVARPSDKMIERRLTLTYDRPVQIKSIETVSEAVTAKSVGGELAKSHVIDVAVDLSQLNGRVRGELQIKTDHPAVPVKSVPVLGRIKK